MIPAPIIRKPNSRQRPSKISNLPPEQRAKIEAWLLDETLTYRDISDKILEMTGGAISISSANLSMYRTAMFKAQIVKAQIAQASRPPALEISVVVNGVRVATHSQGVP